MEARIQGTRMGKVVFGERSVIIRDVPYHRLVKVYKGFMRTAVLVISITNILEYHNPVRVNKKCSST